MTLDELLTRLTDLLYNDAGAAHRIVEIENHVMDPLPHVIQSAESSDGRVIITVGSI